MTFHKSPLVASVAFLIATALLGLPFYSVLALAAVDGSEPPFWIDGIMFVPTLGALLAWAVTGCAPRLGRARLGPIVIGLLFPIVVAASYFVLVPLGALRFTGDVDLAHMAVGLPIGLIFATGEEIGWRGYLLPYLRRRFGFGISNAIVIVAWLLFHVPVILLGFYGSVALLLPFALNLALFSLLVGVLWEFGGGVLMSSVAHATWNLTVAGEAMLAFEGQPSLLGEFGWIATILLAVQVAVALAVLALRSPNNPPRGVAPLRGRDVSTVGAFPTSTSPTSR